MKKVIGLALVLALGSTLALAKDDDDDDKVPAAEVTKIEETLSTLGCSGYNRVKKEEQGIYEIDDAKCKMGTVDIKLDKDYTVILISRYYAGKRRIRRSEPASRLAFSFRRSCAG